MTLAGEGKDLWESADQFHYVYRPLIGDGAIVAHVANPAGYRPAGQGGVMIRETIAADAANAFMGITPGRGARISIPEQGGPLHP